MSYENDKPPQPSASDTLLKQLATDPLDTARGEGVDMGIQGIIKEEDYRTWVYIDLRGRLFGSRFYKFLYKRGLKNTVGVGGRGRIDTLKAANVGQGGSVHTEADLIKPNWVVRNLVDKEWETRQRNELGLPKKPET